MTEKPEPCEVCGAVDGVFHSVAGWLCEDIHGCYERRVAQSEGKRSDIRECKSGSTPTVPCEAPAEKEELPTLPCPCCYPESLGGVGIVFEDARGGFECTKCDARFLIEKQPAMGYAGPGGPLAWWELHGGMLQRWSDGMAGAGGVAIVVDALAGLVLLVLSVIFRLAASGFRYREVFRP